MPIFVHTKTKDMATTNTIVKLLNEAGYRNTNTNRERAVRNMNMLLDAGIMSIKFVHADKYNDEQENWGFWFESKDGKKRCTAYKVTIFGKTFNGHFIAKKSRSVIWGIESVNRLNNYTLSIEDIQIRVARLISIVRGQGDFLASNMFAQRGECSCSKCHGRGIIPAFMHYAEGICFDCGGSGIDRNTLKMYIAEALNSAKS